MVGRERWRLRFLGRAYQSLRQIVLAGSTEGRKRTVAATEEAPGAADELPACN